ncbi:MAG TPA: NAD-dependent epimerase/dehydratase family protein [Solirubrobacteraceae bacterium]|nr:NAD-dependent epimerase/dehydratase family protein [Solirubrobacteraceae bacterium]
MISRRVIITGVSTYWGGRLAQALEADPRFEAIIGIDKTPPKVELQRTEFVRVLDQHSLIRRLVEAAEIDTVVDTRMVVDSIVTTPRLAHENNVIGTMNILTACTGPDSPVRKVVFKSSAHFYGAHQDDPAFFTEAMDRPHPPRTLLERDIVEAEGAVREFSDRNPDTTVTVLRLTNGLGPDLRTSLTGLFGGPVVPAILGFDPRCQFVHADDIVGCLEHAVRHDLDGVFNCAADGVLSLSEVADLLGKPLAPILPPWGTGLAAAVLRRAGLDLPPELQTLMRFGRGLDNRAFKATGYRYRYTSRETVLKLREFQRLHPLLRRPTETYRYEEEVEEFLRYSPSVRPAARDRGRRLTNHPPGEAGAGQGDADGRIAAVTGARYEDLEAEEVVAILPSLERRDLENLRLHERERAGRERVVTAIDRLLAAQR